jgi:hypothetical protein
MKAPPKSTKKAAPAPFPQGKAAGSKKTAKVCPIPKFSDVYGKAC